MRTPEHRAGDGALAPPDASGEPQLTVGTFLGAHSGRPLIQREEEMGRAAAALGAVAAGNGRVVLVSGEPGIGKTRLAQEVTLEAHRHGFVVATGRCYEPHQAVAYYPLLEAFSAAYGAAPASLQARVPRHWPDFARLLPAYAAHLGVGPSPERDATDQQRLFWQATAFMQALATHQPIALLLDDLHWADDGSLALFEHLARFTHDHPILLLGTYRDLAPRAGYALHALLRGLGRDQIAERITLRRLSPAGTARLVETVLGEDASRIHVPADLVAALHERSNGVPFFAAELLRTLVDRGDVYRSGGGWAWRGKAELELPESVRELVGDRLTSLGEAARNVLYQASILGQVFAFDELQRLTQRPEAELEHALYEAMDAHLLHEAEEDRYVFQHALIQSVLYAGLPLRPRRRLHRQVGDALEGLPDGARMRRSHELAWHFTQAGEPARALPYLLLTGDQAEEVFAHVEAEQAYRKAFEFAHAIGECRWAAEGAEKRGDTLLLMGRYADAREAFAAALECVSMIESVRLCGLWTKIGKAAMAQRNTEDAARAYRKAHALLGEQPQGSEQDWWRAWIELHLERLMLHYWQMQHAEMAVIIEQMRDVIERHGTEAQQSEYFHCITRMRNTMERFVPSDETLASATASLICLRAAHPLHLELSARFNLAFVRLWRGDLGEAETALQDVVTRAQRGGDAYFELLALTYLAILYRKRGRTNDVECYAAISLERATRQQVPSYIAAAHANQAWLALRHAEVEVAGRLAQEAIGRFGGTRYPLQWLALWPAIGVAVVRERVAEAVDLARELLPPPQQLLPPPLRSRIEQVIAAWDAGETEHASAHLRAAVDLARDGGYL